MIDMGKWGEVHVFGAEKNFARNNATNSERSKTYCLSYFDPAFALTKNAD